MRTSTRCRRAFTLIEMLIVIVVIGILAGIYPLAAEPAIERARATDCLSDRTTIKHQYYIMRSENGYNSEDFAEAVKKDLGRSNVEGDGSTFSNICRDGGVYTCSMDEYGRFSIVCSVHNTSAGGTYTAEQIAKAFADNMSQISTKVKSELNSTSTRKVDEDLIKDVKSILENQAHVSLDGYDWKITPKGSNTGYYYVYLTTSDIANTASGTRVDVTRYTINTSNGNIKTTETGTALITWNVTFKKLDTNQGSLILNK